MLLLELALLPDPFATGVVEAAEPGNFLMDPDGDAEGGLTLPDMELVWTCTLGFFVLVAVPVAVPALLGLAIAVMSIQRF